MKLVGKIFLMDLFVKSKTQTKLFGKIVVYICRTIYFKEIPMDFPVLYKKTSIGALQFWQIKTNENEIIVTYGQLGTSSPQVTTDVIAKGKNLGKINATTPAQQAHLEATARWEKHLKSGYVQSKEDAEQGNLDAVIEGGILPMLAHTFSKQGDKIVYPALCQPKLDGIRCICIISQGKCTLWSRTRKLITGVPHINRALEDLFPNQDIMIDGELYNHSYKKDFEKIVSFVRQEAPIAGHEVVQYHIYDYPHATMKQEDRTKFLQGLALKDPLILVETVEVNNEDEMMACFDDFLKQGYEGLIARNKKGLYVNKRSYDLQKVKIFDDAEFKIIGIEEGRGKLAGHAIFVCETSEGNSFKAKMKGDTERLKEYFDNHSLWEGKKLTVKYQGLTAYGIPRFPVGMRIHEEL
jgi:DNA ligase-1